MPSVPHPPAYAQPLLLWYRENRRVLPFRERPTAYGVWVSEIMLQQTRVSAVLPYYERFMRALPDVQSLAACGEERLFKLWEGLGYYSRARNLHKAAKLVVEEYGGALPASYEGLLALPGIGPYTAGAVASIAFGLPVTAVDGNVLRVFSRLSAERGDVSLPKTKARLEKQVQAAQPPGAPGDYNQALMELGALVCLPKNPRCAACPLSGLCEANRLGMAGALPVKAAKPEKREAALCVLVVHSAEGVLLRKRPPKGLLAGLWEPLTLEGTYTEEQATAELAKLLPGAALGAALPAASHTFTHKIWRMYGWAASCPAQPPPEGCIWATAARLSAQYPLPSAFKAYLPAMLAGAGAPPEETAKK